jgi:threonine synthase
MKCQECGRENDSFGPWLQSGQRCAGCGSRRAEVVYFDGEEILRALFGSRDNSPVPKGLWRYFDLLPLHDSENIITAGEGIVPIDRWQFLERFAESRFNLRCRVFAHRNDNNYSTGTFKDLAGSVVASVLKENGIGEYVVASTGNIGVAYSRYLSSAGISLYAFIPENSSRAQEAEIGCFGQGVFRVMGDYARAKGIASEFSERYGILPAAGSFDPMRIEAKKTMAYEWARLMEDLPTVYIQALSGGTGPLGVARGCRDLQEADLMRKMPRMLLVQSDKCSPMADAWSEAKSGKFPEGWEGKYPVYQNPETMIPTLATGDPEAYPVLSRVVSESDGEIIAFAEEEAVNVARIVAFETSVRMGPAAAIAVGGFFKSLRDGHVRDGDVVLVNVGEGIRRSPSFMEQLIYTTRNVTSVEECSLYDRSRYREEIWGSLEVFLGKGPN